LTPNTIQLFKNAADRNIPRLANKPELSMELWIVIAGISGLDD